MSTYREMVYMVLDQNKLSSDDAYIEEEHVMFILSKIRAYLIKNKYEHLKAQISASNFQTVCIDMVPVDDIPLCLNDNEFYLIKSTKKVPDLLLLNNYEGLTQLFVDYGIDLNFTYVNPVRFDVVGYDKWQRFATNYATIGPDNYLYIKSAKPEIQYLESIKLRGVFEDIDSAAEMSCELKDNASCSIMDEHFPLEEGLITPLLEMAGTFFYGINSKAKDEANNASDDLHSIEAYLNQIIKEKYRQ